MEKRLTVGVAEHSWCVQDFCGLLNCCPSTVRLLLHVVDMCHWFVFSQNTPPVLNDFRGSFSLPELCGVKQGILEVVMYLTKSMQLSSFPFFYTVVVGVLARRKHQRNHFNSSFWMIPEAWSLDRPIVWLKCWAVVVVFSFFHHAQPDLGFRSATRYGAMLFGFLVILLDVWLGSEVMLFQLVFHCATCYWRRVRDCMCTTPVKSCNSMFT